MNIDNVKLWFAKDNKNNIITIDEITEQNRYDIYNCPMCGSFVKPKAISSVQVTEHFAHTDASKCNSETMIHWWFKNKFLMAGDSFKIISDIERTYVCKEVLIEQSFNVSDKIYKPDITVLTESNDIIYFEMDYSNKKKVQDYIDIWLDLKNIVVEVDIKKLINKENLPTFKALFYNGKCFNTKKTDIYYNTLGKYKENMYRNNIDSRDKERIKKLDWFWCEIEKYKLHKNDIQMFVDFIDAIESDIDKYTIINILKRIKCNSFIEEYYVFNIKKIEKEMNLNIEKLKYINENLSYNIKPFRTIYDKLFTPISINIIFSSREINEPLLIKNFKECNLINKYIDDLLDFSQERIKFYLQLSKAKEMWDYKSLCKSIDSVLYPVEFKLNRDRKVECNRTSCINFDVNDVSNYYNILVKNGFLSRENCINLDNMTFRIKEHFKDYLGWKIRATLTLFDEYSIELSTYKNNSWCRGEYINFHLKIRENKLTLNYGKAINYNILNDTESLKKLETIIRTEFEKNILRINFIDDKVYNIILKTKDKIRYHGSKVFDYDISRHDALFLYNNEIVLLINGGDLYYDDKYLNDIKEDDIKNGLWYIIKESKILKKSDNKVLELSRFFHKLNKEFRVINNNDNIINLINQNFFYNNLNLLGICSSEINIDKIKNIFLKSIKNPLEFYKEGCNI